jgi:hypothetical protein
MNKYVLVKVIAIFVIVLLVINTSLMVFERINLSVFWIVIILSALIAYKGLPYLNKAIKS